MQIMPKPLINTGGYAAKQKIDGEIESKGQKTSSTINPVATKMIMALRAIKNTVFKPLSRVRNFAHSCKKNLLAFRHSFNASSKAGLAKTRTTARRTKDASGSDPMMEYITEPSNYIVTPKYLLSSLINDGLSDAINGKAAKEFLIANPDSSLFSSDNIKVEGYTLKFLTPLTLPAKSQGNQTGATDIAELVFDKRAGPLGEFRGGNAKTVFEDNTLHFSSLNDLCRQMTLNPERNYMTMRAADMLAEHMNSRDADYNARLLQRYPEVIDRLLERESEESNSFHSKYSFAQLVKPTDWNRSGKAEGFASLSSDEQASTGRQPAAGPALTPDQHIEVESTVAANIRKFSANAGGQGPRSAPAKAITTHAGKNIRELISRFEAEQVVITPRK